MPWMRPPIAESITHQWARRIAVTVIGGTVCLIGLALVVLPGPAFVVLPIGLGILSIEYAWARRWLARLKDTANGLVDGVRNNGPWARPPKDGPPATPPAD
jgi:tellurite resistance protein TerC